MRYFIIAYLQGPVQGMTTINQHGFPNLQSISDKLKEVTGHDSPIVIINIIELTEQDYEQFIA